MTLYKIPRRKCFFSLFEFAVLSLISLDKCVIKEQNLYDRTAFHKVEYCFYSSSHGIMFKKFAQLFNKNSRGLFFPSLPHYLFLHHCSCVQWIGSISKWLSRFPTNILKLQYNSRKRHCFYAIIAREEHGK